MHFDDLVKFVISYVTKVTSLNLFRKEEEEKKVHSRRKRSVSGNGTGAGSGETKTGNVHHGNHKGQGHKVRETKRDEINRKFSVLQLLKVENWSASFTFADLTFCLNCFCTFRTAFSSLKFSNLLSG